MKKLIRITTVPESIQSLLQGQLRCMSHYFDVVAISSSGPEFKQMLEQEGVRGICVDMTRKITPFSDIVALAKMIIIFRREKPDIVHTHTPKAGIIGMLAAWIVGVPLRLHTVAGMPLLVSSGIKKRLLLFVEKLTYACATNIYPNSFALMKIILDLNLTSNKKLKVIANGSSNGIDTNFFSVKAISTTRENFRKELGIDCGDFVFLYVGRIVKDKGINELVCAFKRLANDNIVSCKLLVVGNFEDDLDPILPENERFICNSPSVKFVGYQNDVRPFFLASDLLVFPSYREGFPNVVMQAGAMGIPSIVSDINGCNEIIVNGKNGIIIPPSDEHALYVSMKSFLQHAEYVSKMGGNIARSMITSRYERNMVWNELLNEYKRLLSDV